MKIYISTSNNPYFNLALENWLFLGDLPAEKIIYLWQNKPSVIIGRAQNPWQECDLIAMKKDDVKVIRRQSGGGTVYHDMGNINYTIISHKDSHNIQQNLELVCSVMNKLGVNIYPNCRNDIVTDYQDFTYKVSGSAFREKKDRAFQHGTLLLNTEKNKLYNYLHHPIDNSIDSKGVKSHRSKVINLKEINSDLNINDIMKAFITNNRSLSLSFVDEYTPLLNNEIIINEIEKLKNWDWTFGKTLPFTKTYTKNNETIIVEIVSGYITSVSDGKITKNMTRYKMKFRDDRGFDSLIKYCR